MAFREPPSAFCLFGALAVALLFTPSTKAQQQTTDVTLTISFANGQTVFHVGETIPLELAFTALVQNTYGMSSESHERDALLRLEEFHVTPAGRDPLHGYYAGGLFGGFAGSFVGSGPRYLGSEPQAIHEDLNEWVALDRPGMYSLYVTSGRVSRRAGSQSQAVQVRSNVLYFELVQAEPAWQEETAASAIAALDDAASTEQQKHSALRTLRFLDSPGSIRELVRQLGNPANRDSWDCVAGLMDSLHQRAVLHELETSFAAPDTALTSDYILALAATRFLLDHEALPPYPQQSEQKQREWKSELEQRLKSFAKLQNELYKEAAATANSKGGEAQAETVRALLSRAYTSPSEMRPVEGLPGDVVTSAFLLLPADQQAELLDSFWARVSVAGMAEALERILDEPQIPNQRLRDLALRRLYELNPGEGAERILAEIRQPHTDEGMFTVSAETLALLPEKTLPEFDEMLVRRLEEKDSRAMELDAQLIGRYATKAILSRVRAFYASVPGERWDCAIENGLLTYFLRVDSDYAVQQLKASASPCLSGAYRAALRMGRWPEIEPSIIQQLNSPNLWIARAAAETLAKYGGPGAEAALWKRLRQFDQQWASREKELWNAPVMRRDVSDAIGFEFGLVEALGKAQAWLLDNDQITELGKLALGQERAEVARWLWHSPLRLSLGFIGDHLQADISGTYFMKDIGSLRAKLAQFPIGTEFRVNAWGSRRQLTPVIQAIEESAQEHGLSVEFEQAN